MAKSTLWVLLTTHLFCSFHFLPQGSSLFVYINEFMTLKNWPHENESIKRHVLSWCGLYLNSLFFLSRSPTASILSCILPAPGRNLPVSTVRFHIVPLQCILPGSASSLTVLYNHTLRKCLSKERSFFSAHYYFSSNYLSLIWEKSLHIAGN